MNWFTRFYRAPSAIEVAARDISTTQLNLLDAHKELEWAQARIDAYEARIVRLQAFVAKNAEPQLSL